MIDLLVKLLSIAVVVPTSAAIFVYLFLFKTMARMHQRYGPMEAGPHGAFQLVAEGLKFVQKEDLFPAKSDRVVFGYAPIVILVSTFLMFAVIPAAPGLVVEDLDVGILYVMAVASLSIIGVLMAAWGSANKYSLLGGLRAAAQLLAYEIPLVFAVLSVVVQAETMSMVGIVEAQQHSLWFVLPQLIGFIIFLVAAQAELTQTPFDMPVAETEVVAGYLTEYSGFRFLLFFLSELATAAALSAVAVTLYLGGWTIPFVHIDGALGSVVGVGAFTVKTLLVAFVIFWVRFSVPRLREDQLQSFAWKCLIPVSLALLAVTGVCKVVF